MKRKALKKKDFKKLKIGVLMGGMSSERAISLLTGKAIYRELKKNGHNVEAIDINSRSIDKIIKAKPDVIINGLHGMYGEDGIIQSILDFLGIPYAGSGPLSSAIAMNKMKSKEIFKARGIPTPRYEVIESEKAADKIRIKLPVVVKPVSEGSAVGVTIAKSPGDVKKAYRKAAGYGRQVIIEKFIKGREISVPVLADKALPVIEIVPVNEFYDYDAKYTPGKSAHIIPAVLEKKIYRAAQETAVKVHNALLCRDFSRVDMILKGGKLYVLENNTLPGMTGTSLFPEAAAKEGICFYELLSLLIKKAYRRG